MLFHIVSKTVWQAALVAGLYQPASLKTEGFIHLSTASQVPGVIARYYRNVPDLLLLHIEAQRLKAPLKYEVATGGESFPHLYGPLNLDAVVKTESVDPK